MTTIVATIVGVKELKQNAPKLVERAAAGESIVITRYGRARAKLGPAEAAPEPPETAKMAAWRKERAAFEGMQARLERRYRDRYVAVSGGRVVDADGNHEALYQRVRARMAGRVFFIGRIGGPPPLVEMPGFEVI